MEKVTAWVIYLVCIGVLLFTHNTKEELATIVLLSQNWLSAIFIMSYLEKE